VGESSKHFVHTVWYAERNVWCEEQIERHPCHLIGWNQRNGHALWIESTSVVSVTASNEISSLRLARFFADTQTREHAWTNFAKQSTSFRGLANSKTPLRSESSTMDVRYSVGRQIQIHSQLHINKVRNRNHSSLLATHS
jgi:hypothetical protein